MLTGKRIVSYRPGVAPRRSAFECMAAIYRRIHQIDGCEFKIVMAESDDFTDDILPTLTIPDHAWRILPIAESPRHPRATRRALQRILDGADLLLTVDPTIYPQGIWAIEEAKKAGLPVIFDTSVTVFGALAAIAWRVRGGAIRRAVASVDAIIATVPQCVERFTALQALTPEVAAKFRILGHPVDTERFTPRPPKESNHTELRMISVGRLVAEKGYLYMLEALAPLLQHRPELQWLLIGDGPLRPLLEREVRRLRINGQVQIRQSVDHREIPAILQSADIYISHAVDTSYWQEYFGVANLEAMACGVATIVSKAGSIPQVIRETGACVFVPPRDIPALRDSVTSLLDSAAERDRLGRAGRTYVSSNYALDLIVERYREILVEVLSST